ncbi:MAG: hypothetical protein ACLFVB_04760 [Thermoplasmata archaeon]
MTSENFLSKFPHIEEWGRGTIDMIEDTIDHCLSEPQFEEKLKEGLKDIEEGNVYSHEEVKEKFS